MTGGGGFSNAKHLRTLSEERRDGKESWDVAYESRLKGLVGNLKVTDKRLLLRARIAGALMSVRVTEVSGTLLSATEFRDFLCPCYNVSPVNLQSHCDGRGTVFGVTHALICRIGGLVIARHNQIRDRILYIPQRAYTSASVCAEHLIHRGRTKSEQEISQGSDKHKDTKGEVMIHGLWDRQVYAIIDAKLGDADADTYNYEPTTSLLARWEKIKKDKHGKHCNDQQKLFSPFVLSVDRMLGRESLVRLSQLSRVMAEKREEPLSQVRGWVNGRIAIAVARSYSRMKRGARICSPLREQEPD